MINMGDFFTSDVVYRDFTSINAVGVAVSMAGSPVVKVMKDDGTAQSTAGVTLVNDLGGTVGLNSVKIDTSADGSFYASGHDFFIVITAGTIAGQSVIGYVIATFSLQNRSALRPTTKGRTLGIASTGQAGIDWANIASPTTAQDFTQTTIKNVDNAVPGVSGNVTGSVGSVTGNVGGNVVGSVASVTGNVGGNVTGTVGSVLGNLGGSVLGSIVGSVNSVVTAVTITAGSVQAIWDALTSALTTVGSIGKLLVTNIDAAISSRAPASTAVSNVDYTSARAAKIDNLDVAVSTRLASASYTAPDNADIVAIKAKTDNLPADPASNTQVNTRVSTAHFDTIIGTPAGASVSADIAEIEAETDGIAAIPTNPLLTTDARLNNLDATISSRNSTAHFDTIIGTPVNANISADIAEVEAETDGIAAIPTNPLLTTDARLNHLDADISSRVSTAHFDTIIGTPVTTIAGDIAEIEIETDDITAIKAKTDQLTFAIDGVNAHVNNVTPVDYEAVADAVWDEVTSEHVTLGTFGAVVQNPTLSPTQIADAVWDALTSDHAISGTFGLAVLSGAGFVIGSELIGEIENDFDLYGTNIQNDFELFGTIENDEELV